MSLGCPVCELLETPPSQNLWCERDDCPARGAVLAQAGAAGPAPLRRCEMSEDTKALIKKMRDRRTHYYDGPLFDQAANVIESLAAKSAECERERDEARRHHKEMMLGYVENRKYIAERFGLEQSELQWQWRQGERSDRSEIEWAIVDALAAGCVTAYIGDGVGCAAQIVTKQMDIAGAATARAESAEAKLAECEKAAHHEKIKAVVAVCQAVADHKAAEARVKELEKFVRGVADGFYAAKDAPRILDEFIIEARRIIERTALSPAPKEPSHDNH
jgi:hypothetical protein